MWLNTKKKICSLFKSLLKGNWLFKAKIITMYGWGGREAITYVEAQCMSKMEEREKHAVVWFLHCLKTDCGKLKKDVYFKLQNSN